VLRGCITDSAHCVARYGGEEFAFLLPHCAPGLAQALAEVGRQRVKALKVRDRRTQSVVLTVTISAGVASMQPGDDAQTLVARADEALYAAKEEGRDRVVCA
jgi:diguanylate cyclase